ncbi:TIGR00266 family protein [Christensenellaceae bacterium OttesenSCG-928-L17]|nr:TIGR00266 family protein [Christensenellaceae bacterium OttesenSCG-928-L17]
MQYRIFGDNLPAVEIQLNPGESIYTESGGMSWMSEGMQMETNAKGGVMKGLGRMLTGESFFMATFTASRPGDSITVASSFPGHILALDLSDGREYVCQKDSFLCAQPTVTLSTEVVKGLKGGLFGGEGFFLQRLRGSGMVFLEIDGSCKELLLAPGERIKVDTSHVALYEASVRYSAEMVKGFKNVLFGGEGLFLTTLEGPGRVWLQTMTIASFAGRMLPYIGKD